MPPSLLNHLAIPMLQDFRKEFPDILIDVSSSHVTGLPAHDLDVAVVYDRPNVDDKVTDLLWMVRVTPVCSPTVAAEHAGKSLDDFLAANELLHVKLEGEPRGLLWGTFARQCGLSLDTDRGLAFDTAISAVHFARSGAGVALADLDMFAAELASGELVAPYETSFEDGFRTWAISRFSGEATKRSPVREV
jgi:LysR family glycine cleavage system transcriptional activator